MAARWSDLAERCEKSGYEGAFECGMGAASRHARGLLADLAVDPRLFLDGDLSAAWPPAHADLTAIGRGDVVCADRPSTGSGGTRCVSYLNEHVGPMAYPLLSPAGERCWCPNFQVARAMTEPPSKADILGACVVYARTLMVQDGLLRKPRA